MDVAVTRPPVLAGWMYESARLIYYESARYEKVRPMVSHPIHRDKHCRVLPTLLWKRSVSLFFCTNGSKISKGKKGTAFHGLWLLQFLAATDLAGRVCAGVHDTYSVHSFPPE